MYRCGSEHHYQVSHTMCPLNEKTWPGLKCCEARLNLYVGRKVIRTWDTDAGKVDYDGVVSGLNKSGGVIIHYPVDGKDEDVSEQTLLKSFKNMKTKLQKQNRKRKRVKK